MLNVVMLSVVVQTEHLPFTIFCLRMAENKLDRSKIKLTCSETGRRERWKNLKLTFSHFYDDYENPHEPLL